MLDADTDTFTRTAKRMLLYIAERRYNRRFTYTCSNLKPQFAFLVCKDTKGDAYMM